VGDCWNDAFCVRYSLDSGGLLEWCLLCLLSPPNVSSAGLKSFLRNISCCTNDKCALGIRTRGSLGGKQLPCPLSDYPLHMNCVVKVAETAVIGQEPPPTWQIGACDWGWPVEAETCSESKEIQVVIELIQETWRREATMKTWKYPYLVGDLSTAHLLGGN
jgi:hypothetical protein